MVNNLTKYKKLTEVEHCLARPARYLGSIEVSPHYTFYFKNEKPVWGELHYSPAFLKLFDEIISNSVDFSKRAEGKHLDLIDVSINRLSGEISVYDNGGIPVEKHPEYDQYIPDFIFGELRTGSNFDDEDDSTSTGQNGEGVKLSLIFSERFKVDTADGKNRYERTYLNNGTDREDEKVTKSKLRHTRITYIPDYARFKLTLDDSHYLMLERRVYEIAACNPHLNIKLNGEFIKFKDFHSYVSLFSEGNDVTFGHNRFEVSVFPSQTGFQHVSYINSTCVHQGGTQIQYVMNQIITAVRDHVMKKTKQDVKPSDIQNHFFLFINATINNPRYNSQTKEKLETLPKNYGTELNIDDKTLKKIINSEIVASIIEWAENKKLLAELAAAREKNKENKKSSLRDIIKYEPATEKVDRGKCILFLSEGESAAKPLISARDARYHGIYELKGKPVNVRGRKLRDLIKNVELNNIMRILGLEFGVEPDIKDLRYGQLCVATDMDADGSHLAGLVFNMFHVLWPSLMKQGFIVKLITPIIRAKYQKKEIDFFTINSFEEWAVDKKGYQSEYLKGLGSNDTVYFKKYMHQKQYFLPITIEDQEDFDALDIAFAKGKADGRKEFLYSTEDEQ